MMAGAPDVLEIAGVTKAYSGLRPLRIRSLRVEAGERVAIAGLDAAAAELLVNLVTGAALPDAGTIRVLGHSTAEITDGETWLSSLDRFGIVTERAVMLEGATLAQNLAMPFTLEIEPVPPDVQARVSALAVECGIAGARAGWLERPAGEAPPEVRLRGHVARAVALEPSLLLLEHPTATMSEAARDAFAADLVRLLDARGLAALVITQDGPFAARVAHRALTLDGATGELAAPRSQRWWW
jgi:phospholipid/cholesterol/gamma-HCH transport system ATP-binding protein